jgi:hypothetical protein
MQRSRLIVSDLRGTCKTGNIGSLGLVALPVPQSDIRQVVTTVKDIQTITDEQNPSGTSTDGSLGGRVALEYLLRTRKCESTSEITQRWSWRCFWPYAEEQTDRIGFGYLLQGSCESEV